MSRSPAATAAVVAVAVLATFVAATGRLLSPALVAAALLAGVAAHLAASRPLVAAPLAAFAVAVVPIYWGRGLGGFGVAAIPVTLAAVVLAPAAARHAPDFRIVALDAAVATYLAIRSAAYLLNYATGAGAAVGYDSRVVAGYAVFRLLGLVPGVRRRIAVALVAAGTLLAVASRFEAGGHNVFFRLLPPGFQASAWARPELRFRIVRVESSFGHPIPFGLFLALVIVLALGLAVHETRGRLRAAYALAAGLAGLALLDTLSRGPLLVAVVGVLGWVLLERRSVTPGRVASAVAVVVALALFTPALVVVGALRSSSQGDTREARSAEYRIQIASLLTDPDQFTLLGRETEVVGDVGKSLSGRVGFKSLDNEYAVVYVGGGLLSLVAFLWIVLVAMRTALLPRLDPVDRSWAVAIAVATLGLSTVALLTQYADLFWISLALLACIAQERGDADERRPPTRREAIAVSHP